MATVIERLLWNAQFGQSGEVNSKEGVAFVEGLPAVPPNYSEVGLSQVECNKKSEKLSVLQPVQQEPSGEAAVFRVVASFFGLIEWLNWLRC